MSRPYGSTVVFLASCLHYYLCLHLSGDFSPLLMSLCLFFACSFCGFCCFACSLVLHASMLFVLRICFLILRIQPHSISCFPVLFCLVRPILERNLTHFCTSRALLQASCLSSVLRLVLTSVFHGPFSCIRGGIACYSYQTKPARARWQVSPTPNS